MNSDQAKREWEDYKSRLKARWSKLSDTDIEKFRGNLHLIPKRIQSLYSISKGQAEQEYEEFKTEVKAHEVKV